MNSTLNSANSTPTNKELGKLCHIWQNLQAMAAIKPIHSEEEYQRALDLMEILLQAAVEDKKNSSLTGLLETLGILISNYEDERIELNHSSPIEVLTLLIAEHDLQQKDLPEIGSQGIVSEVLAGKRELNKRQIIALAVRFGVSPAVFM